MHFKDLKVTLKLKLNTLNLAPKMAYKVIPPTVSDWSDLPFLSHRVKYVRNVKKKSK